MEKKEFEINYLKLNSQTWENIVFDNEDRARGWLEANKTDLTAYTFWNVVICSCGERVYLQDPFTNQCVCGKEYNGFGQELAPRSQWGWETGEIF